MKTQIFVDNSMNHCFTEAQFINNFLKYNPSICKNGLFNATNCIFSVLCMPPNAELIVQISDAGFKF